MKAQQPKTYQIQENLSKKKVYSNKFLPQETRKASNRQPNSNLKKLEK